jgi:zinc protease
MHRPFPLRPKLGAVIVAAWLATTLTVAPASLEAKIFEPESFVLDNGLQVVVVANHRAPIVTHMIWYKVGAADEDPGKSGLAHFLEHLMFKGTERLGPGIFSEIIAANGGQENAFTTQDATGYFQTINSDRLEIVMEHEADRMTNLKLSDELVLPERDVVLEERRSRVSNEPSRELSEMARASLYLNHPYRFPVIGWANEIAQLTTEDALAFYRRWYAPNNAVLVLAGDVTAAQVRPLAEKYYGAIPARAVPKRERAAEPEHLAPRRVTLESPRVRQPSFTLSYLAPSFNTAEGDEAYALQILDEILSGGATSRLYRSLVVEQSIAVSAGSGYSGSTLDLATFTFYVSPRPGTEIEAVEAALRAEIEKVLADGVSEAEVQIAKQRMKASAIFARDNLSTPARLFGRALTIGRTVADVENWPDRIGQVTAEEVLAAARQVFRDKRSVSSLLLPEPTS